MATPKTKIGGCVSYRIYGGRAGGKSRFIVVHMEINAIINNDTGIISVSCIHNCKSTFAHFCVNFCLLYENF